MGLPIEKPRLDPAIESKLMAAVALAELAAADMIEAVRDGDIHPTTTVGSGNTLILLADALRLTVEATPPSAHDEKTAILKGALEYFFGLTKNPEPTQ